jgi:hypothetical protein
MEYKIVQMDLTNLLHVVSLITGKHTCALEINVREYQRGNQKWTIQRNWQHRVHKTKTNKANPQHNMCWTPLYRNKHN